jgi:multiple sugar transport system substrate-binding protein
MLATTMPRMSRLHIVSLLLALVVSACGGSSAGEATLDVWVRGTEGELLGRLVPEFEAAHPGIKVKVTAVPTEASHDKYLTAIAGGNTPDVALLGTTWMAEFARTNALQEVPGTIELSQFFPGAAATVRVGRKDYGVPWYVETRVLYYRTDIARRAGVSAPPRTWEQLKSMARAMQAKGGARYGIFLSTANWFEYLPFVWQAGGDVLQDGHVVLDSPEATDAFGFYKSFFDEGLAPTNLRVDFQIAAAFVRGTHPMFFSGPWQMGLIREVAGKPFDSKWAVAPMPSRRSNTSFVGGGNWVVFNGSAHREAAWSFVSWMSAPKTQARWFEISSDLPANRAAWDLPPLNAEPRVRVFGEQLKNARSPAPDPRWEQYAHALETGLDTTLRSTGADTAGARQLEQTVAAVGHE